MSKTIASLFFVLVLPFFLLNAPHARAQQEVPSAPCTPPAIPEVFKDQAEVDAFTALADEYKACIDGFVAEQEQLMIRHQNAANRAVKQWNDFVAAVSRATQKQDAQDSSSQ